jgi:hypothetical protein
MPIGLHAVTIPSYLNWLDSHIEGVALATLVTYRGLATKDKANDYSTFTYGSLNTGAK